MRTSKSMSSHILIISAVEQENSFLAAATLQRRTFSIGHREITEGMLCGHHVRLLVSGPGIMNTIQAATICIEVEKPSLIIQTGSGGAFKQSGLKPGDIGIATEEIDGQLGIEAESAGKPIGELPFPVLVKNSTGYKNRFECSREIADHAENVLGEVMRKRGIDVRKGPFVTVSTITATDKTAANLFSHYGAIMESMEGCGTAYLALLYDVPFLEIRAASNMVGRRNRSAWNLPLACERSNEAVMAFLRGWTPD